jgi:parallel beta-helix repeat protein
MRARNLAVPFLAALAAAGAAPGATIVVKTTIQAAVDAAQPGDTVRVPPGVYRENVSVTRSGLTITGSAGAVLDGTGLAGDTGILAVGVDGLTVDGLTVRGYAENGILIQNGSGFAVRNGRYQGNGQYGIFALFSGGGVIEMNHVEDSDDTAIYIGQSSDVVARGNRVTDSTVGIEVENSLRVQVVDNRASGNSTGVLVDVLPGLDATATSDVLVADNVTDGNNRPNPATDPEDILSRLPSGVGILNVGGDAVLIRGNVALGNDSFGIGVVQLPPDAAALDPRIDPFPDANLVVDNVTLQNGKSPDPKLAPLPPADLLWDTSGSGDCWRSNVYRSAFPEPLPGC